jgi:serpin B
MVVVVPDLGQLAAFEAAITADQVQSLFASLATRPVQLSLPKFGFKNVFALKEALQSLGMVQAWTTAADFSGMVLPTTDALHLAEAYHDTFITVTEDGTEAGAATGIVVEAQSDAGMPGAVDLIVDRPFLFFIRDVSTGAVLFAGRVLDPTAP